MAKKKVAKKAAKKAAPKRVSPIKARARAVDELAAKTLIACSPEALVQGFDAEAFGAYVRIAARVALGGKVGNRQVVPIAADE